MNVAQSSTFNTPVQQIELSVAQKHIRLIGDSSEVLLQILQ